LLNPAAVIMTCMISNAEANVVAYKESKAEVVGATCGSRLRMTPRGTLKGIF
jgi:hypothetical protein